MFTRRGDLRRRRLRPLRDVLLHRHRRLRRRADGRAARPSTSARRSRRARSSSPRSARCSCPTMVLVLTALAVVTDARARVDLQPGRARLLRGALRLHVAGEQQRQRVRRLRRDELLGARSARSRSASAASCRCSPRSRSAARSRRRRPRRPRPARSAPTAPTFVVLLVGVIVLTAGLMIFPALTLGPIVEGLCTDAARPQSLRDRRRRAARSSSGSPTRLVMTGFAQVAFPNKANGSLIKVDGKVVGSRLAAQAFTKPQLLPPAAVGDRARLQRRRHDLREPRPDEPRPREGRRRQRARRSSKLERPYNPGLDDRRHPRRRGHDLRLGHRPATSRRPTRSCRRARIAAVRGLAARARAAADRREHRRPLARLPRRARRQRARAQPRTRPGAGRVMARAVAEHLHARASSLAAIRDSFPKLDPRTPVPQPGDVHRRARQRDHDGDLLPRPRPRRHRRSSGSSA